jgi:thiamine-phosphate pyrophosphorylase
MINGIPTFETKTYPMGKIDFTLYLITDRSVFPAGDSMFPAIEAALQAGVRAVQLREKDLAVRELLDTARLMKALTDKYNAKLFINDRVDIALAVEADGVHLGQKSIPAKAVRDTWGDRFIIGVSVHGLREAGEAEGADFITLGPIYDTPSKRNYGTPLGPSIIGQAKGTYRLPVFAIGGINTANIQEVGSAGADGIAVISAVLKSSDIPETTRKLLRVI